MFICSGCKKSTQPGTKMTKKVVETRKRDYFGPAPHYEFQGTGHEIAKEAKLCPECAKKVEG